MFGALFRARMCKSGFALTVRLAALILNEQGDGAVVQLSPELWPVFLSENF